MDLHILAATAHHLEGEPHWGTSTSQPTYNMSNDIQASKPARSRGSHRVSEAKRRERINERLSALRELVPHDTRSNTATFLEGVISYIHTLQQSNAQLEAELSALKALRAAAAANLQQQQQLEVLAQPAGSGSNPAESSHQLTQHQQQQLHSQHQYHASSWRQDSITGPPPYCPEAAATAAAAAAGHWQAAAGGPMLVDDQQEPGAALQAQQQRTSSVAMRSSKRQALSCSPTHTAAAAAGPCSTLSAPAALMHSLIQQSTATPADAATGPHTGLASSGGGPVQPQREAAATLQPAELQSVLERALLAALQQQAQHLASQLRSSDS